MGCGLTHSARAETPFVVTADPTNSDATGIAAKSHETGIQVLPETFTLVGPQSKQRVAVVATAGHQSQQLVAWDDVTVELEDPRIASFAEGIVRPLAAGTTRLIVRDQRGWHSQATIVVRGFDAATRWSFQHDVQSVLSRLGCNMGACHGALAGKGGFRLSLRGYDTAADYHAITRHANGRRIEIANPGESLLLAKPTGALPHKGGLRLEVDSDDYQLLARWIADGAPASPADDPELIDLSVLPERAVLQTGDRLQLLVTANYSDGSRRDVTHWSKFTATEESVALVDQYGQVQVQGPGESAVSVWFGSRLSLARLTIPFALTANDADQLESEEPSPARHNFIDTLVAQQLQQLGLATAPTCDDTTFIRRVTLDCIGRLPTMEETQQFLADTSVDKRERWIERLLARDEFVDYWAYKWSDVLLINGTLLRPAAVKSFYQWVRQAVSDNQPWDQMVRDILTSRGSSIENGATNFFAIHQSPEEMTENACQAFLGLSIGCAKCHNHPLEKWTNDQYYAMANLFARVRAKGWGGDSRNGDGIRTVYVATDGELIQPTTGRPQPPAPLDAPPIPLDDPGDRREVMAQWMTAPENPYFARAISNRIWKNFFGIGLVEDVDDLRLSNPAANEPLMEAISQHLIQTEFDLQQLMRVIMQSQTYQRESAPSDANRAEQRYFSRYYPRRLMAEVLLDAMDQVLQTSSAFTKINFSGADNQATDFYPAGTRALQLFDSAVDNYFLQAFGRNSREITCECERSSEPDMVQVLHLSNGKTVNEKLADPSNRISQLLDAGKLNAQIVETLFWTALSRPPTPQELGALLELIAEYPSEYQRQAIEDVFWSVLSTSEFLFNH